MTQTEQIAAVFPQGEDVLLSTGKTFTVKALKVGQIPKAVKLASTVAGILLKEDAHTEDFAKTLLSLFTSGSDELLELVSYGIKMDRAEFDDLELDDAAKLAAAFIKANQDFFVQRVLPLFPQMMKAVKAASTD